jgi:hypothetical protein
MIGWFGYAPPKWHLIKLALVWMEHAVTVYEEERE